MSKQSTRELTLVFFVAFVHVLCYCVHERKAIGMKKESGAGYIVLIIIILVLGYLLYHSYDEGRINENKVLEYVRNNISFSEICDNYKSSEIKEYIYNRYIPSDIWDDVTILQDTSWWELIDYGKRDMYGQTLMEYLDEAQHQNKQDYLSQFETAY